MKATNTDIEILSKSADGFAYSGEVNISILDGDRVLTKKKGHNQGRQKLFNFLTDCLTGNFNVAKSSRPCRIILYKFKADETEANTEVSSIYWNDDTKVSTKVYYDSAAAPGTDATGATTVTYHFRIPYLCLVDGSRVRKLGLYPDIISDYVADLCAYYILPETDEIQVPEGGSNFTIAIDWTLKIKNA